MTPTHHLQLTTYDVLLTTRYQLPTTMYCVLGVSGEEQIAMAKTGKEMVFAEHDKVRQYHAVV